MNNSINYNFKLSDNLISKIGIIVKDLGLWILER